MRVFGLTITRKPAREPSSSLLELSDQVKRLVIEVRTLQDELSQLQGHHLKLRKQFDGSKGGRPVGSGAQRSDLDTIPTGDKAALRAYAGLRPGQPVPVR